MSNYTVTCRCTRLMRPEQGRPANYLMCSCGTRVRIDDHQHDICHVREKNGDLCVSTKLVVTYPLALCGRHAVELLTEPHFAESKVIQTAASNILVRKSVEKQEAAAKEAIYKARYAYEQDLRKGVVAEQEQVYYIALRDCIKIGTTYNMVARMSQLMPDAVLATEPGGREVEKARHRQFKTLRAPLGREYFSVHPDLLAHIEAILVEHGPPTITTYPSYDSWHLGEHMLLSVKDAAKLAKVPLRTIYEWVQEERLTVTLPPGRKRGAMVNYLEVEQLLKLRRAGRMPRVDQAA